jgi:RNA polymerase-binding protein DksA
VSQETGGKRPRKIKSPLNKRELQYFLQLLLTKRAELIGDMSSMSTEALNPDAANLSHYADHMADMGSDNYEQELTLGLVESERQLLTEIDEAIERIREGTYGVCVATGEPIGKPRLEARPWSKYCIEAARAMERSGSF